jgi:hypothetical protein
VDDLVLMQVHQCGDDLRQIVLHLHFSQALPALDQLIEGLVGTYFQQNIHVFVVFEDVLELDDILVAQRLVDFNLSN